MFGHKSIHARKFLCCNGYNRACIIGANYTSIFMFGCCGVPILTGPPGSCSSEASKCALSTFGVHESHTCNNQTTSSYIFKTASKTTVPICVDDVNEKAADAWEELLMPTMVQEGNTHTWCGSLPNPSNHRVHVLCASYSRLYKEGECGISRDRPLSLEIWYLTSLNLTYQ